MSWTNPAAHVFATSEVVTASTMNTYIQANLTFLGVGFGAQMNQATAQSIPTSTPTIIHFDTIINDPNGMCTTGSSAKITIPANAGGVYVITWSAGVGTAAALQQWADLVYNGTAIQRAIIDSSTAGGTVPDGTSIRLLNPTDTIQVQVNHDAGAAENTSVGIYSYFGCHLISPN